MRRDRRPGVRRLFRLPLFSRGAARRDVDDELDALIASRVEHLVARGMSPAAARDEALRRLGASLDDARLTLQSSAEHRERRMRFTEFLESVMQDVHYAARGLMRRPAFTAVAVLTLAIGVGATTAIFSAVNALLLRPLPYAHPDELMRLSLMVPARSGQPARDNVVWSYPKFAAFRDAQQAFSDLAVYSVTQVTLAGNGDDVERISGEYVGASYLRVLGLNTSRGRDFDRAIDAHPGAPKQVVISYALWLRRYNADPSVIGRTLDIDRDVWAIIGVGPRDFRGLSGDADVFMPVTTQSAEDLQQPQSHFLALVGRRARGVNETQAEAAVTALGARISDEFQSRVDKLKWGAKAVPLNDTRLAPAIRRSLLVLFGAVGLVLLIACVNVANLLLGRASARRREIAVRVAIGAGRARLIRLLLTESLLLAAVGAVASVAVAWAGVRALGTINPATTLRLSRDSSLGAVAFSSISLDWSALAFTFAVSLVVGVLFGLAPALGAARESFTGALKGDRVLGAGAGRRTLVVAEVALALVLLAGSGLMIRSLANLLSVDSGFDGTGVLTFRLTLPPGGVARDSMPGFYSQLIDRVRAVPGVTDVALDNCAPTGGWCSRTGLERIGVPGPDIGHSPLIGADLVTPNWFSLMKVHVLRGRVYTDADRIGAPKVIVLNEAAVKMFFGAEDPIGKRVSIGMNGMDSAEVIGVVANVRQQPDSAPGADSYVAYNQSPRPGMVVFVRTSRDPASIGPEVRRAVHDVAARIPVYDMLTMRERASASTAQTRFRAVILALFAITALSLAAVGIYGVMSLAVTARTREMGIRIALGAESGRVQRLVIGEGIGLVAVGAVIGLAGALAATRLLRTFLFDLTSSDPLTYAAIVVVLGTAAIAASWIPARRASRVDPVVALRAE
jgi:putative ABC transport system permease protein